MKENNKKIVCIDFDGVLHSYTSGWQGASKIPDQPIEGAIAWLISLPTHGFIPCIYSCRNNSWFGKNAIKSWLKKHIQLFIYTFNHSDDINAILLYGDPMAPYDIYVSEAVDTFVNKVLKFAKKPVAHVYIDDRAICFNGKFPTMESITKFKPWNK